MFVFFIVLSIVLIIYIVKHSFFNNDQWSKGLFPSDLEFTHTNLMEAYICLAARLLAVDRNSTKEKIAYMQKYCLQYFPNSNTDLMDALSWSYKNPVQTYSIVKWINRYLRSQHRRIQVMYFLAGMSAIDGTINAREMDILRNVHSLLGLTPKEFDSIIAIYTQRDERKANRERPRRESARKRALQLSAKILGVSEHASMDEIKKAYRNLAKLHHPDRFATYTEEEQLLATERFTEIQKAYETLEKLK